MIIANLNVTQLNRTRHFVFFAISMWLTQHSLSSANFNELINISLYLWLKCQNAKSVSTIDEKNEIKKKWAKIGDPSPNYKSSLHGLRKNLKVIAWSSTQSPIFTFFNQWQMVRRSVITFSLKTWRLSARKWRRKFAHDTKAHFHSIWNIVPESTFPIQQLINLFCQALCIEASRHEFIVSERKFNSFFGRTQKGKNTYSWIFDKNEKS